MSGSSAINYDRMILSLLNEMASLKEQLEDVTQRLEALEQSSSSVPARKEVQSFVDYLVTVKGMKPNTAASRFSNCNRVERYEGSIEDHYHADQCKSLLKKLEYSMEDHVHNCKPRNSIPISGNVFNGINTLRKAVQLYVEYLQYTRSKLPDRSETTN